METKVPFYNIVNIFLPGLVLLGSCLFLFLDEVKCITQMVSNIGSVGLEILVTVSLFAIAYEVGYILFRLGEAVIQPIIKKLFGWAEYSDFIAAGKTSEKAYEKLEMLSREYGYARTQIVLFIIIAILTGIKLQWWFMGISIACVVLFVFTARGHMIQTQRAVKNYLATNNPESEEK